VLLAYSKIWLKDEFVESDLPEDVEIATALARYFPPALQDQFGG
jgi:glutamate dehydrogenase